MYVVQKAFAAGDRQLQAGNLIDGQAIGTPRRLLLLQEQRYLRAATAAELERATAPEPTPEPVPAHAPASRRTQKLEAPHGE
jgi:hypothetical protein